jgi:hypothetical protein
VSTPCNKYEYILVSAYGDVPVNRALNPGNTRAPFGFLITAKIRTEGMGRECGGERDDITPRSFLSITPPDIPRETPPFSGK